MRITSSVYRAYNVNNKTAEFNSCNNSKNKSTQNADLEQGNYDMFYCDADIIDYKKLTNIALENLAKSYKGVKVYTANSNQPYNMKDLALSLGEGKHIVISQAFIDRMSKDIDSYSKGKAILEEVFKTVAGSNYGLNSVGVYIDEKRITFFSTAEKKIPGNTNQDNLFETMKKLQQQADDTKNKFKVMKSKSVLSAPMDVYTKLARAGSVAEVKSVMANAKYNIIRLRAMLKDCDESEKTKIRAAIRQLEKALTRSSRKVKDLTQEKTLRREQINAEAECNKKRSERKKQELQKRRALRHIRERAQLDEANPLYYYPQLLLNKKNKDYDEGLIQSLDVSAFSAQVSDASKAVALESVIVNAMPAIEISFS